MARIFVTHPLPGDALAPLAEAHDLVIHDEDTPITREQLLAGVADADVLLCLLQDQIDKEVFKAGRKLKIVGNYAVGTNNINVDWATLKDIAVLNTPYVLTDASADMAFALLLSVARRLREGDQLVRSGQWTGWQPAQMLGTQVSGKTLGIVGMGRIGQALARRALAFNMRILYHNRHPLPIGLEREFGTTRLPLNELLQQSDFVSLHCPLTPQTKHLIDQEALDLMPSHAFLINTARGPVVDEQALVDALKSGSIAGAGLDVYEEEPQVHPDLCTLENVVLTPHLGSATHETRAAMARILVNGVLSLLNGQRPPNLINPEVY